MASRTLPGLKLEAGWSAGEDGWGSAMNTNLAKISVLAQLTAVNIVDTLPGSAADGEVYLMTSTAAANPGMVAARDDGLWRFYQPEIGWRAYVASTGGRYEFAGGGWNLIGTAASIPAFSGSVANFNLSVNPMGNGVMWTPPYESPYEIPVFAGSNLNDVLSIAVDSDPGSSTGVKLAWRAPPLALPAIPADSKGKTLVVDATGTAITYEEDGKYKTVSPGYVVTDEDLSGRVILGATGDVVFPTGLTRASTLTIVRMSTSDVRITGAAGVTLNVADGRNALRARFSAASIIRTASEVYTMFGDVSA